MGSSTAVLTQLIQDAVLKLCTQNVVFTKSLEIDGIICVSPGDEAKEIVVKMHRTIMKPEPEPQQIPQSWSSPQLAVNNNQMMDYYPHTGPGNQSAPAYQETFPGGHRRPPPTTPQRNRNTSIRDNSARHHDSPKPPPVSYYSPHEPPSTPIATQKTPGGPLSTSATDGVKVKDEPDIPSSIKSIKRSLSNDETQDSQEEISNKQAKLTPETPSATEQNTDNVNVKQEQEEPITIELDDDEEEDGGGGYDEDSTAGASWMGDDTLDTSANNQADQNTEPKSLEHSNTITDDSTPKKPCDTSMKKCHHCSYTTNITYNLTRHMQLHQQTRRYNCHICGKSYADKYRLSEHHKFKHCGGKVKCDQCEKEFTSASGLQRHVALKHEQREAKYVCTICDVPKKFVFKTTYDAHMVMHDTTKHHKCKYCEKTFSWAGTRSHHEKICKENKQTKIFGCFFCDKQFTCRKYLMEHAEFHNGNKTKIICSVCGKSFSNNSNLRRHKKVHKDNKEQVHKDNKEQVHKE